ncbi:MAG: EAL domain-containing protein [Pseudomonadota bacterium]|jgi:diguanylate cyclase (GGDEF)-like protein|nr:EAL domain-containing protein [Xanthomonadaceae bacterium]MDE2247702.1 EAL domain-containing protein [Xanthomonadaceae bacterium]MDE3210456.1 EAL domain-containing protein [Pseudomonadota bacterium]
MTGQPATSQRPSADADGRAWLSRLIGAATPADVAAAVVARTQLLPGCQSATVLHGAGGASVAYGAAATAMIVEWAQAALARDCVCLSDDGRWAAWPLLADEQIVLLLHFASAHTVAQLRDALAGDLALAAKRLAQTFELINLHGSHKQLERSENLQRALFAIADLAGSELDMPEMLHFIHQIVSSLMYGENFFIVRYDPLRATWRFLYYADVIDLNGPDTTRETPLEQWRGTLTYHVLTTGQPMRGSSESLRAMIGSDQFRLGPDSSDWLGVPMLLNGQVHGALVVQSYEPGVSFTVEDQELLGFVGTHILTALERKQSKDELESRVRLRTNELAEANLGLQQEILERERAERLQAALFQLAQLATADIDEHSFYQRAHAIVGALLNAENFYIALLSEDRNVLYFPYYVDVDGDSQSSRPLGRGLSEYVLRSARPLLASRGDLDELVRRGEVVRSATSHLAGSWLGVPLQAGDEVIGLVVVQTYLAEAQYSGADQELLTFAALQIANSIYRRRTAVSLHQANIQLEQRVDERTRELRQEIHHRELAQEQLKHQVMHDPLTGLPNRGFLRDRLDRVLGTLQRDPARRCALLYLDVDRFKVINDSIGHLAGDDFLKAIAGRLLYCVREPDMVARLSGDEFAILLEDVPLPETAAKVAQRILRVLGATLQLAGKELEPSASIGIAIGDASYGKSDDLLRDADIALYRAKERGRKRFEMFDETLATDAIDVLALEAELRHALLHDEFEPYFQPICRFDSGAVVGYEALIRWNHPRGDILRPGDFIRVAEDSGLIEAVDWRMFELSCVRFGHDAAPGTFVTINVSARHLRHADFDLRLLQLLARTGLSPTRLVVEVTEGALLDNPERVRGTLERLLAAGVGAALDDFGTGYSSLSYLHSLPLRMLKIDKSFVQELHSDAHTNSSSVVEAILAMARALGIHVIAEGIETETQRAALKSMGCEMAQGYLIGYPGPLV